MEISDLDKKLLMELEYNFPVTVSPFQTIAERLNLTEEEIISKIKVLIDNEIIKRIGMYIN
ncbi:Lrp/AsnC family transcriptional regulator, partial [Acidianus sp. DSM 29099]